MSILDAIVLGSDARRLELFPDLFHLFGFVLLQGF